MTLTKHLIGILEGRARSETVELKQLMEIASKNKVLLELMTTLEVEGAQRRQQEESMRGVIYVVGMLSKKLRDHDYSFFKLLKPVSYVPSDIGVLVKREHLSRLKGMGFRVEVVEPYCVTMVRGSTIVDLYVHPTLGGVIYLDMRGLSAPREVVAGERCLG